MKSVIYYDENNALTHLNFKQVKDDYVLQAGEVWELPNDFLTPAKLVDGKLTSATQEESQEASEAYLKAHPIPPVAPSEQEITNMQLMKSIMELKQSYVQQKTINMQLMKSILTK